MICSLLGRVMFTRRMILMARTCRSAAGICLAIFGAILSSAQPARAQSVTKAFNLDTSFPGLEVDAIAVNTETNKIYIATQATAGPGNSGRIFVLDGATNQTLTSFSDTSSNAFQPFAIAINPVTNIIYVANTGGGSSFGSVTVIDGATDTYVATMSDGNSDAPQAIVVNSETNIVYVANNVSGNVTHYSGSTRNLNGTINVGSSLGTIGVGTGPAALALNPGANLLYVVNSGVVNGSQINHGGISVVNTTSNGVSTVTDTSGALDPVAVAVDVSSGLAYVAENTPPSLTVINGSTYSTTIHDPSGATTPRSVAVNPLTHRVYLADIGGGPGTVSIFQGTTYQATVAMGTGPNVVAVDTATDIAYAPNDDGNISVISGATGMQITSATSSAGLEVISVNPVTHKAYVAIDNLGNEASIAVLDGATNTSAAISAPMQPFAVAVNPVTNTIYVANHASNNVSVIDGVTDTVSGHVNAGMSPDAIVIDPMNNLIYVANHDDSSVTVVDGSTNDGRQTITFNTTITPDSLAFNPIRNTVYGASSAASLGFAFPSFFGDQGAFANGYAFGGMHGIAVAADPGSGMSHTLLLTGDFGVPFLTVDDGAAPFGFYLDACFTPSTSTPIAMDVNTANNTVFVVCSDGYINAFQGASGFTSGNFTNIPPPDAYAGPYTAVAVNPYTNLVYITDSGSSNLIVIDGATNTFSTAVSVAANPVSVAVNIAMNKIYVLSAGTPPSAPDSVPPTVTIVDGATNSILASIPAGATSQVDNQNHEIAVNPATGKIYALARNADNVVRVTENALVNVCDPLNPINCLLTTINPLPSNTTFTSVPTFTFTAANHLSSAPVTGVYFQVDTMQGKWTAATPSGGGFSGQAPSITPGFHMLYAYATAGDDANTSSFNGLQASPMTGAIASYGFLSAPQIANAQPSLFFGNVAQGGSFTQGAYLANEGGAPLNYSYVLGGPDAADFVVDTNVSNACGNSGTIAPGSYCTFNVKFQPSGSFTESATITWTDDSLAIPNSVQTVTLTGAGTAPTPTLTEGPANPSFLTTATFGFTDSEAGVNFKCSLDSAPFTSCTSPVNYSELSESAHTWSVTASDETTTSPPLTVNWTIEPSQVSVTLAGTGTGSVTSSPAGISCPSTCTAPFNGVPVALTATPDVGSTFVGWTTLGDVCPGTGSCTVDTGAANQPVTATFNSTATSFPFTVTLLGTGSGGVNDDVGIACDEAGGVITHTPCTRNDAPGTSESLLATPDPGSTFGGWGGDAAFCGTNPSCSITTGSAPTSVTASFVPGPTTINVTFTPSATPQTQMATYDCPSNPNPTPTNPCPDPNAHALALTVPTVSTGFTMSVVAHEVSPFEANGDCASGHTVANDFDCRFVSFFTFNSDGSGGQVVPLCDPYSNGNCVFYSVEYCVPQVSGPCVPTPGAEPPANFYTGPINWFITWNNDATPPPSPYLTIPRLYDDPDSQVNNTDPYGTSCTTAMQINGSPTSPAIFCQFVYDITTIFDGTKKVDSGIGGTTRQFNDVVVAFPLTLSPSFLDSSDAGTVDIFGNIGFTDAVSNPVLNSVNITNVTLSDPLPGGPGTPVHWTISPAYTGPGTCTLAGADGSQVLNCSFGDFVPGAGASVHVQAANAGAGQYLNAATVTSNNGGQKNQTLLSIATVTVQLAPSEFAGLSGSQTATFGNPVNLTGTVEANDPIFPPAGVENVTITIAGIVQKALIGANGVFTARFTNIPASSTPYIITYQYPGDANFAPATDTSTTLTVNMANQTITFNGTPASAVYNSTFAVSATSTSGLTVTITPSGGCTISAGTVTMTSGTTACTLTASQAGNGNFNAATNVVRTVTAQKANSTTTITSNAPNPSTTAQVVTVAFKVTGTTTPSGSVTVNAKLNSTTVTCSGTLASGVGSCTFTLTTAGTWTLTASYGGDANFNTSTSTGTSQTVNGVGSTLKFTPTTLNFGTVYTGTTTLQSLVLTNMGTSMITFSNFSISAISGDDSSGFLGIAFCPRTLNAGKSCTIIMSFTADSKVTQTHAANLVVADNAAGSPQMVLMTATVINPVASVSPNSLNFGNQKTNTTSAAKTVTVTNSGTTPLTLSSVTISGNFAIASGTTCAHGTVLAPSAHCAINVTFKPTSKGSKSGTLTVTDNALHGTSTVSLSGNGN